MTRNVQEAENLDWPVRRNTVLSLPKKGKRGKRAFFLNCRQPAKAEAKKKGKKVLLTMGHWEKSGGRGEGLLSPPPLAARFKAAKEQTNILSRFKKPTFIIYCRRQPPGHSHGTPKGKRPIEEGPAGNAKYEEHSPHTFFLLPIAPSMVSGWTVDSTVLPVVRSETC